MSPTCQNEDSPIDLVFSWANGSDSLYKSQKEKFVQEAIEALSKASDGTLDLDLRLYNSEKHQRAHGELLFAIKSFQQNMNFRKTHLIVSDFFHNGSWQQCESPEIDMLVDIVGTSQIMDQRLLPVFNSLSIETHLSDIPNLAPIALYVNDDTFLLRHHTTSDIYTIYSGVHFHISKAIMVSSGRDTRADTEYARTEWSSLWYTNELLSRKFGERSRGYVEHIAKAFRKNVMMEVQEEFRKEIDLSDTVKFRESRQVNMLFLSTWYTIEMMRLTLLRSLVVTMLDNDIKSCMRVLFANGEHLTHVPEERSVNDEMLSVLEQANIRPPTASKFETIWTQGYAFDYTTNGQDRGCLLSSQCLYPPPDIDHFDWIAIKMPSCGDCILIRALLARSVHEILPQKTDLGYETTLIQIKKYMYSITSTNLQFINIKTPASIETQLASIDETTAQLCINDDIENFANDDDAEQMSFMLSAKLRTLVI